MGDWIALADAINAVRAELVRAREASTRSDMPFEVGSIEVEFSATFSRQGDANTGLKVLVLESGASLSLSSERFQRITVSLKPARNALIASSDTAVD